MSNPRLKNVAWIIAGQSPPSEDVVDLDSGLPFMQGNAEFGSQFPSPIHECAAPPKRAQLGDILISVRAPVGALNIADREYGIGRGLAAIRPRAIDNGFLRWWLESCVQELRSLATGSTFEAVSASDLGVLRIPESDRSLQQAIASFLDRETAQIDAMIGAQRELVARVEARRQAVLTDTVFQGMGRRAKNPNPSRNRYQPVGFPPLALTRGLSLVPEDWDIVKFKVAMQRLEERNGDGGATLMSLTSAGRVVPRSETGDRQQPAEENIPRYLMVRPGHLIINPMWLTGGAIGISWTTGAVSPDYRVFRSRGHHDPRYLHHLLRAPAYLDQYRLYTRAQTTFDRRVQQPDIDSLPLPVPTLEEQADIAAHLDRAAARIDAVIEAANESISLMQERRAALISAAVTGRIDLRTGEDRGGQG